MFERDLESVDVFGLTPTIAPGGQQSIGFVVRFTFKQANGAPGGPTIECSSAIDRDDTATFAEIEERCLEKARAMVGNLAVQDDATVAAVMAADRAERSKTDEEQSADLRAAIRNAIDRTGSGRVRDEER